MWKEFLKKVTRTSKSQEPIVERKPRELRNFKHFLLNENKTGYIVSVTDKILILQLEECLKDSMNGPFTELELAIAIMDCLIDNKWTPPKIEITK